MKKTSNANFKKRIKFNPQFNKIYKLLRDNNVSTVCRSARCPNITECFAQKKVTFMILGDICTRHCKYCNIAPGKPGPVDSTENNRIINIINELKLKYVIITSVTRDDIEGYGKNEYIDLIKKIRMFSPDIKIELLIPDFHAEARIIEEIANTEVEVIGHNIETVFRLWKEIRPTSDLNTTLTTLKLLRKFNKNIILKSGFMVGLGESKKEIIDLMKFLKDYGVDVITIGQYFQPSHQNIPVSKFYSDEDFQYFKEIGNQLGFKYVVSGRFVRSSYFSENYYQILQDKKQNEI